MDKAELIKFNAAKLRELYDAMHPWRGGTSKDVDVNEACREFHSSYDRLAFPGGVDDWLSRLKARQAEAVEDAVLFLEVDPMFFRSGYIKEWILEHLRWAPLTTEQKKRLQQVIVARASDLKTRREFRRYCRLAPFVNDPEFEHAIAKLAGPSGAKPKPAWWVLEHLKQGMPKKKQ